MRSAAVISLASRTTTAEFSYQVCERGSEPRCDTGSCAEPERVAMPQHVGSIGVFACPGELRDAPDADLERTCRPQCDPHGERERGVIASPRRFGERHRELEVVAARTGHEPDIEREHVGEQMLVARAGE